MRRRNHRLLGLVLLAALLSCSSPNRGYWSGTFDGSVTGVVEFSINARGTKIKGKMTGKTSNNEPFNATLEGILRQDFIRATFEGRSRSGLGLPLSFEGEMMGSLADRAGTGEWSAQLYASSALLRGSWSVEQIHK